MFLGFSEGILGRSWNVTCESCCSSGLTLGVRQSSNRLSTLTRLHFLSVISLTNDATKASSVNVVRSYFRDHGTGGITATSCPGDVLTQTLSTFFCSQKNLTEIPIFFPSFVSAHCCAVTNCRSICCCLWKVIYCINMLWCKGFNSSRSSLLNPSNRISGLALKQKAIK